MHLSFPSPRYSHALSTLSSHIFTFHLTVKTSTTRLALLPKTKAQEIPITNFLHSLILQVPRCSISRVSATSSLVSWCPRIINQANICCVMECWAHHTRAYRSHSQVIIKGRDSHLHFKDKTLALPLPSTKIDMIRRGLPNGRIPHSTHISYLFPKSPEYGTAL